MCYLVTRKTASDIFSFIKHSIFVQGKWLIALYSKDILLDACANTVVAEQPAEICAITDDLQCSLYGHNNRMRQIAASVDPG